MVIKLFSMFSGYGGAEFALKKAGIDYECIGFSEIDKYAIQCYKQNHEGLNHGDATKINPHLLQDFDLLTGGFPCQSFSVAGKGLGEQDTRGTLFYEIVRVAEIKQPKFMLLENVKGLTNKTHKETFAKILSELDRIGYDVQWKVLNTKEHGIPQNRERVFFICIRKDINIKFEFPKTEELQLFLKDILEDEVEDKYYLKQEQVDRLLERTDVTPDVTEPSVFDVYNRKVKTDGTCITLTEPHHNNLRLIEPKILNPLKGKTDNGWHFEQNVYDPEGISRSLKAGGGSGNTPKILTIGNYSPSNHNASRIVDQNGIAPTVKENHGTITATKLNNSRIRKLTPTECFRLMGFLDDNINLDDLSNTQKYKLAGNGWDINLVSKIFLNLLK